MKKKTTLCMGCMIDKGHYKDCSHCGYDVDSSYLASYLAPSTFLIDRYIIGKLISYNGEGALYLAFDTQTDTKVTIKEFMPDTLCSRKKDQEVIIVNPTHMALYKTYLSEFIALNKSLRSAKGGNLQKPLEIFASNNTAYAAYEYIEGISLKSYLSKYGGILTWAQAAEVFKPVLETLAVIHSNGIVHRGISFSTILIDGSNRPMLIGFGISASRTYDSDINFEVFSGYAPPELYCTTARQGSWTDVYGVSAVLYKTLTGKQPFNTQDRLENDELLPPIKLNNSIPKNVSDIIMRGLALKIEERIGTISEFSDRIFEEPLISTDDDNSLIRKPVRTAAYNVQTASGSKNSSVRRKKKNTVSPVIICSLIGVIIIGFVIVIIITALNPSNNNGNENSTNNEINRTQTTKTSQTSATNNLVTESTTRLNEPLYVIPNFEDRPFELIKNSKVYDFLNITPEYEFNNEFKEGFIFEQDLAPETEVVFGTMLTVKVSKGAETVPLPDYTGMNYVKYQEKLSSLNIKFETVSEDNPDVAKDIVIRCSKEIGNNVNVAESETVIIYYSSGAAETGTDELNEE